MPTPRLLETTLALTLLAVVAGAPAPARAGAPVEAAEPDTADAVPVRPVGEVTVTATRAERDVLDVPGHVTVITREEIERSGATTLPELLRREPGLFVRNTTTSPSGATVEARGFDNGGQLGSGLLVLVDGRRANEADSGATDWALLPLDSIERVEIVRGPASALYGDNAVGGVVHVITRPAGGPLRFELGGHAGTWDGGGARLVATGAAGAVGASITASGLETDGYRDGSDFEARDLDAKLRFELGDRVVAGISTRYHSDERSLPGALDAAEIDLLGRRARDPNTIDDFSRVRRRSVQGFADVLFAEDVLLRVLPFHSTGRDRAVISSRSFGDADLDTRERVSGAQLQLQIDRPLHGLESRLLVGGEWLREDAARFTVLDNMFGLSTIDARGVRRVGSVFVQEELEVAPGWRLSAGARYDRARSRMDVVETGGFPAQRRFEPEFGVWSPKAALTWRPREDVSLYASFARGVRLPGFDEQAPVFGPSPDLDAQRSSAYEVGVKVRRERVRGTLALYHMNVTDEITFDPATFVNANFPRVRHRGLEASLTFMPCDPIDLFGGYSLEDVRILRHANPAFEGSRMPTTPRHRGDAGVRVRLPHHVEIEAAGRFVGSRRLSNDFANRLPKLSKYAVYDLVATARPQLADGVESLVTFAVRNVFDREYIDFGADFSGDRAFYPAPTRRYEIGVTLRMRP